MTTSNLRSRVRADLRWGLTGGLLLAAMYCAWVTIVYAVSGPEPFERNGVTLSSVVVTYVIIGAVGGGIVGLLRPLTKTKVGAYAIGFIVGLVGAVSIGILIAGSPLRWQLPEWGTMPIFTIVMGWLVGSELWKRTSGDR